MFFTLLIITLSLSVAVSYTAARVFSKPIGAIFNRIIQDDISAAWQRYVMFATYVVGISSGVRIYDLERYISPQMRDMEILQLTVERWVLEIYRTLIACLQGIAWMYLVVFVVALIAYVIMRGFELKRGKANSDTPE
ncbi:MAG: hypothetical protein CMQ34_15580 [Gammaproteobacteria bacterium]|nr:hypothetical protein [Gammaproteobacteria bacterium]|tara:strand:+ start:327 stop:737 length:411 start_codon:yes stop_codon:yes gene_type:complete